MNILEQETAKNSKQRRSIPLSHQSITKEDLNVFAN